MEVRPYSESDYLDISLAGARSQWQSVANRSEVAPGRRQVPFVPVETLLCLCAMLLVDHTRFGSMTARRAPEPVQQLARLFKRPPSSILAKMANLDGSRSHGATYDLLAGLTLRTDAALLTDTYRTILKAARSVGISTGHLSDFLGLEDEGALVLQGQEELRGPDVESALEREMLARFDRQANLSERDTQRLTLVAARVGQHRFAVEVLSNYGQSCVFCGFSMSDGKNPTLLRAGHIKPWSKCSARERLDVSNGLAACPTHDAAFDAGLITLEPDLTITLSPRLKQAMAHNAPAGRVFGPEYIADRLDLSARPTQPGPHFLDYHRSNIFVC